MPASKPEGQLDPGAPPRHSRSGSCKCLLFSLCTVISLGIVGLVLYLFYTLSYAFVRAILIPHAGQFHDFAIESVKNPATVVQPLVDRHKTFDLAATVWIRTSRASHLDGISKGGKASAEGVELVDHLEEEPLFSDIIFRGVRLSDKNLHTTVNFTVPTALLFPLGSQDIQEKTLADRVLESFAVSIPLIQFHGIQSRCATSQDSTPISDAYEDLDEEDGEIATSPTAPGLKYNGWTSKNSAPVSSLERTDGRDPLQTHPYIVTRTQIRAVNEDRLIDRNVFAKAHKLLKESSCGQEALAQPNQYFCKALYRLNGNWETQLQLRIPDALTGKPQRGWAYAPYFYLSKYGLGQKDLLEIPVQREKCSEPATGRANEELAAIDVSWKISYIGRTPSKMSLIDMFEAPMVYAFNTTDDAKVFEHDNAEMMHGLLGHRFNGLYFFSRTSTVSLSIPGTTLIAAADIINKLDLYIAGGIATKFSMMRWIRGLCNAGFVLPLIQLKAVYRLEFDFSNGMFITLRRAEATHLERANERLEGRTSNLQKIGLLMCGAVIYYFVPPQKIAIIPAITLPPKAADALTAIFPTCVLNSMDLVGIILQIILNWRSRTFGGKTRVSAVLTLFLYLLNLATFVPAILGRHDTRGALNVHDVIETGIALVMVWQALTLPVPKDVSDEDHVE
ncbi:hypothetical protein DXG01_009486 [Tephrocybe rancida]|nr:hypothetical protein DXG01_009486 [Tephrocybe rancida]